MKGEAARILVVDDERLIRWALDQQLRREGYGVRLAETGAEALQAARTEAPDLVLLDMRLPDADGVEILERLRALDPECPVIMITAHGAVESCGAGHEARGPRLPRQARSIPTSSASPSERPSRHGHCVAR